MIGGEIRATATRKRLSKGVMAFRIQKYLGGLRYPARKLQIVDRARELGADPPVIHALLGIPERTYESPIVLSCEVGPARPLKSNGALLAPQPAPLCARRLVRDP